MPIGVFYASTFFVNSLSPVRSSTSTFIGSQRNTGFYLFKDKAEIEGLFAAAGFTGFSEGAVPAAADGTTGESLY